MTSGAIASLSPVSQMETLAWLAWPHSASQQLTGWLTFSSPFSPASFPSKQAAPSSPPPLSQCFKLPSYLQCLSLLPHVYSMYVCMSPCLFSYRTFGSIYNSPRTNRPATRRSYLLPPGPTIHFLNFLWLVTFIISYITSPSPLNNQNRHG